MKKPEQIEGDLCAKRGYTTGHKYRKWLKRAFHRCMRRDWKARGEDAGKRTRDYTRG